MASYVDGVLMKDESVVYRGKITLWSLSFLFIVGFLLLPFFGIGLLFWLSAFIRYKTTELAVTNKRVIAKFGLLRRDTIELSHSGVESLQVSQTIIDRILNAGTIIIQGTGGSKTPIPTISNPLKFRREFLIIVEGKK